MKRWQLRFQNFNRAFLQLENALKIVSPSDVEREGIIQRFEYTFELAWKVLQDYLKEMGTEELSGPKQVIIEANSKNLIRNGEIWLKMLEARNIASHEYSEPKILIIYKAIVEYYFSLLANFNSDFNFKILNDGWN